MKGKRRVFHSDFAKIDATPGVPDEELPELTEEMMDQGVWEVGGKVIPTPRPRGRPAGSGKKVSTTLRIDKDVIAGFRAGGPGWQTRMNWVLRTWLWEHAPKKPRRAKAAAPGGAKRRARPGRAKPPMQRAG